jgi:hypothetical protein
MKKTKKYAGGGLSGIAQEATSLMGAVDNASNAINTIKSGSGGQGPMGGLGNLGFLSGDISKMTGSEIQSKLGMKSPETGLISYRDSFGQPVVDTKPGFSSAMKIMPAFKKGGKVSSASKRADGVAIRGKTKGRMV